MGRFRKIAMKMHADEKYRRLTPCPPCGQALWWHLIAGEQTGLIPGLSCIGEAAFAEQLGWSLKGFREGFGEVFREGMAEADWKARLIWVPKAIFYNPPANPNVVLSWRDAWDELPECKLKTKAAIALRGFLEGLGKGFGEAFEKVCRNPSPNQEQEQEQEKEQEQEQEKEQEKGASPLTPLESLGGVQGGRFAKPTLAEVTAYCHERANAVNPQAFLDHYEANGWKVGRTPMKDWKAAVRTWERNAANFFRGKHGNARLIEPSKRYVPERDDGPNGS